MVTAFDLDPVLNELWQQAGMERLRYDYNIQSYDTILDIGAYQGEWSKRMVETFYCQAILFEPVRVPALDDLRYNPKYEIVEAAAWTSNGELKFGGNGYWTSAYIDGEQWYRCVDIRGYICYEIAVCKINAEGAEYGLLNFMIDSGLYVNVRNFQIQFHRMG